jgi:hypothetical protein
MVDAYRRRQRFSPPLPKCVQCNLEPRVLSRADKLGKNCGEYADKSKAKVSKKTSRPGDD